MTRLIATGSLFAGAAYVQVYQDTQALQDTQLQQVADLVARSRPEGRAPLGDRHAALDIDPEDQ